MRNPILMAAGLALLLCISCTSCKQSSQLAPGGNRSRGPGEIDDKVDYKKIGSCYGPSNYWKLEKNAKTGDQGYVCSIQVESLKNYGACDYNDHQYALEPKEGQVGYHDPVQLFIGNGDHIYFWSDLTLATGFRVRRFIRTTNDINKNCRWPHPFKHEFKKNGRFVPNDNSAVPKPDVVDGCEYKLEVQIEKQDNSNQPDPDDDNKHYLCYDPHIRLNQGSRP